MKYCFKSKLLLIYAFLGLSALLFASCQKIAGHSITATVTTGTTGSTGTTASTGTTGSTGSIGTTGSTGTTGTSGSTGITGLPSGTGSFVYKIGTGANVTCAPPAYQLLFLQANQVGSNSISTNIDANNTTTSDSINIFFVGTITGTYPLLGSFMIGNTTYQCASGSITVTQYNVNQTTLNGTVAGTFTGTMTDAPNNSVLVSGSFSITE
jgi:hypothetical protein